MQCFFWLLVILTSVPFPLFSVRVSNELGLGHSRTAKYSVYVTVFQSFLLGILFMVIILLARDYIAFVFTSSTTLQKAVSKLAYLLGATMLLNSVQPVISGLKLIAICFPVLRILLYHHFILFTIYYSCRCCCWWWMADIGGLHQRRLLLHFWPSTGIPSWF